MVGVLDDRWEVHRPSSQRKLGIFGELRAAEARHTKGRETGEGP